MNAAEKVTQLLSAGPDGIRLGSPNTAGALTLVPVFHDGPALDYITYSEAVASNLATVDEVGESGTVPNLTLHNLAPRPLLLVEGEVIIGLKQNRVVNVTILAAPASTTMIPVACVEQGRWQSATGAARRSDVHLAPRLRASKNLSVAGSVRMTGRYAADQGEVWDGVAERLQLHDVASSTHSYEDIAGQHSARIRRDLDKVRPAPGQSGVLALIAGEPVCLDLFDRASTLEQLWDGLIAGYWVDALADAGKAVGDPKRRAASWLAVARKAVATEHAGVGMGRTVALTSSHVVATALVVDGVPVHVAAFAPEGSSRADVHFMSPRQRRPRPAH